MNLNGFSMPYVLHAETWRKQQISKYEPGGAIFLGVAGVGLKSGELLAAYRKLPRAESSWGQLFDLLVTASEPGGGVERS